MAWIALLIAGLLEVIWVYTMKESQGFSKIIPSFITIISVSASFYFLSFAMKTLPISTAYIVWVGIGAIGAFFLGILALGEPISPVRFIGLFLIISGLLFIKYAS